MKIKKLTEAKLEEKVVDQYYYVDDATNTTYVYDTQSGQFTPLKGGGGGGGNQPPMEWEDHNDIPPMPESEDDNSGEQDQDDQKEQEKQKGKGKGKKSKQKGDTSEPPEGGDDEPEGEDGDEPEGGDDGDEPGIPGKKPKGKGKGGGGNQLADKTPEELRKMIQDEINRIKSDPTYKLPEVGDKKGENSLIQQCEDALRKARDVTGEETEDELDSLEGELDKTKDMKSSNKKAERLAAIKDLFNDQVEMSGLMADVNQAKRKEIQKAKEKELRQYQNSGEFQFEEDLRVFVKNQLKEFRAGTWSRQNYNFKDDIMRRGRNWQKKELIPKFNVYFDRSGSWDDAKTKSGEEAMAVLNDYEKKGAITVDTYYFANTVSPDKWVCESEGGTAAGPEIVEHCRQTKPTNIIIMTDSDCDYQGDWTDQTYVAPGGVWYLFKGGRSSKIMAHITGNKFTQAYDFTR